MSEEIANTDIALLASASVLKETNEGEGSADVDNEIINESYPVYISYANDEKIKFGKIGKKMYSIKPVDNSMNKTDFVKELCKRLEVSNIRYKIDKEIIQPGDDITSFEKEIGTGMLVIVILSDKYLTSPHCMYEWKEIHKNTYRKTIIYVYFNNEDIIVYYPRMFDWSFLSKKQLLSKNGEINLEDKVYKSLLYDRWGVYMKQCVDKFKKADNKYTPIVEQAFNNHFYLDELDSVLSKIKKNNTPKTSQKDVIDIVVKKVVDSVNIYNKGKDKSQLCSFINEAITKPSILIVGDNIMKYTTTRKKNEEVFGVNLNRINVEEKGRLGDYYNMRLFSDALDLKMDDDIYSLTDWYDRFYGDKETILSLESREIGFKQYEKYDREVNIDDSDLYTLLESNFFDVIISFGYSEKVYNTVVKKYGKSIIDCYQLSGCEIVPKQICTDWDFIEEMSDFSKDQTFVLTIKEARRMYNNDCTVDKVKVSENGKVQDSNEKKTRQKDVFCYFLDAFKKIKSDDRLSRFFANTSRLKGRIALEMEDKEVIQILKNKKNEIKNDSKILYIELVKTNGRQDIIFSEEKIVRFINACVIALYNYNLCGKKKINNRFLLTLGTCFPSWTLRIMWERLTNNEKGERCRSLIENKKVGRRSERMICNNKGCILKDEMIEAFMNQFNSVKSKYIRMRLDAIDVCNCFVSYVSGNEEEFYYFVEKYLDEIEKKSNDRIHFVWKKNKIEEDVIEMKNNYKLQFFYFDKQSFKYWVDSSNTTDMREFRNNRYFKTPKEPKKSVFPNRIVLMQGTREECFDPLDLTLEDVLDYIDLTTVSVDDLYERINQLL